MYIFSVSCYSNLLLALWARNFRNMSRTTHFKMIIHERVANPTRSIKLTPNPHMSMYRVPILHDMNLLYNQNPRNFWGGRFDLGFDLGNLVVSKQNRGDGAVEEEKRLPGVREHDAAVAMCLDESAVRVAGSAALALCFFLPLSLASSLLSVSIFTQFEKGGRW